MENKEESKVCSKCKINKKLDEFYFANKLNRCIAECKSCISERDKKRYFKKNKIRIEDKLHKNQIQSSLKFKICIECNIEKNIIEFAFRKGRNKYKNKCKECEKDYMTNHAIKNKEKIKIKKQIYSLENKKIISERGKGYYIKNKDKIAQKNKLNIRKRRKTDLLFKLSCTIRTSILKSFKKKNHKKTCRTVKILGCSFAEFKTYIEQQFESWMTWENHGMYNENKLTWHLDHIIPVASSKTEEELIKLNHYTNFQPLLAIDNIRKSNKLI